MDPFWFLPREILIIAGTDRLGGMRLPAMRVDPPFYLGRITGKIKAHGILLICSDSQDNLDGFTVTSVQIFTSTI